MAKFNRKISWKSIISIVLIIAAVVAIGAGVSALAKRDTKNISSLSFERGALDEKGEYTPSKTSVYTKEGFKCKGITINPDFEFKGYYDVYYYDINDSFLIARTGWTGTYREDYPLAVYARVVIHPEPVDDDGKKVKDFEISFWEETKYAKQIEITVDRDQTYAYENPSLFDKNKVVNDKTFATAFDDYKSWNSNILSEWNVGLANPICVSDKISVDGTYEKYDVYVYLEAGENEWPTVALFDASGNCIKMVNKSPYEIAKPAWVCLTLDVSELNSYDGVHLMVHMPQCSTAEPENICYIFGYND